MQAFATKNTPLIILEFISANTNVINAFVKAVFIDKVNFVILFSCR